MAALPASALADAEVVLSDAGFTPLEVVVKPGEKVIFQNTTATENVRFEDEAVPRCQAPVNLDCERTFPDAGVFKFYDAAHPGCTADACDDSLHGVVIVDGPPAVT